MFTSVTQPETTGCLDDEPPDYLPRTIRKNQKETQVHYKLLTEKDSQGLAVRESLQRNGLDHPAPIPTRIILWACSVEVDLKGIESPTSQNPCKSPSISEGVGLTELSLRM